MKPYKNSITENISLDNFITVIDAENGKEYFGGSQMWFEKSRFINIYGQGCGIIAAVNTYLYIVGIHKISKSDYMKLVYDFVYSYPTCRLLMTENPGLALGAAPFEISSFLKRKLHETGKSFKIHWGGKWTYQRSTEYTKIKEMLTQNFPVIWAIHNSQHIPVNMYKSLCIKDGSAFLSAPIHKVHSHYVTITGLFKGDKRRIFEVSSWGEKYYIDYDEYLKAEKNTPINNKFSSIEIIGVEDT